MRFGTYVNINTEDEVRLKQIKDFGFDYIEPGLADIYEAEETNFDRLVAFLTSIDLSVTACNCMFPSEIRITGEDRQPEKIKEYLEVAFSRASRLNVKKVVLGSGSSRSLPDGYPQDKGYDDIISVVRECVIPACEKYGITVTIEPLRHPCNLINTLSDGMRVVVAVHHPQIRLLADSLHMMSSGEDMDDIIRFVEPLQHVHVCDKDRLLPEFAYSSELTNFLDTLKASGYDGDVSFEANIHSGPFGLQRALLLLKQKLM